MTAGKVPENICKIIPDNFTAMVELINYGKRIDMGRITAAEWLVDFRAADMTYYYNKEDLESYYLMMENWEKLK